MGMSGDFVCVHLTMSVLLSALAATPVRTEDANSEKVPGGVPEVYIRTIGAAMAQTF